MKKYIILLACALGFSVGAKAQAQPFVAPVGTVLSYNVAAFNEKKNDTIRITSTHTVKSADVEGDVTKYTIEEVTQVPDSPLGARSEMNTTLFNAADGVTTFIMEEPESTRKDVIESIVTMYQEAGHPLSTGDREDLEKQVTVRGQIDLAISPDMAEGTVLPKKSLKINAGPTQFAFNMWEGKILGNEKVTTEAGEFDCLKLSYVMKINAGGQNQRYTVTEWYAPGVGTVKSVNTDKKGKVIAHEELTSINK
ncbi:MAG: DUF3108 domain-containing protein [Muribaculaceae bacterium]|nr:DUF3108 domain-containing protein [Muribaculaceae bacterium]